MKELDMKMEEFDIIKIELADTKQKLKNVETALEHHTKLVASFDFLKEPPFYHMCSFKDSYDLNKHIVPYEKLMYQSMGGDFHLDLDAGMDIDSGKFKSGWPGTYQITWSFYNEAYQSINIIKFYATKLDSMIF